MRKVDHQHARRRLALGALLLLVGALAVVLWLLGDDAPRDAQPPLSGLDEPVRPPDAPEPAAAGEASALRPTPAAVVNEDEVRFVMIPCSDHEPSTWSLTLTDAAGQEVGRRSLGPERPASFYELDADASYGVDLDLHGSWLGHAAVQGAGAQHLVSCDALPHVRGVVTGFTDPTEVDLRLEAPGAPPVLLGEDGGFRAGPVSPSALVWVSGGGASTGPITFAPGVREPFVRLQVGPAPRLGGRVVDDRGRPVAALVRLVGRAGTREVRADPDGSFELAGFGGFPADVCAQEGARCSRWLTVDDGAAPVELTLGEGSHVSGVVVRENGEAYFDGHVTAAVAWPDGPRRALDVDRGPGGAFRVGPFPPGASVEFADLRNPGWAPLVPAGRSDVRLVVPTARTHRLQVEVGSSDPTLPWSPTGARFVAAFGSGAAGPGLLHPIRVALGEDGLGSASLAAPPGAEHDLAIELRQPGWTATRARVEPVDDPAGEFDLRVRLRVAPLVPCHIAVRTPDGRPVTEGSAELRWEQPFDVTLWASGSQLRSAPARDGRPEQAWLTLDIAPPGEVVVEHEVVAPASLRLTVPRYFPVLRELPHPLPRSLDVLLTPVPEISL